MAVLLAKYICFHVGRVLQAGARMVYAVEASNMAGYCKRLVSANPRETFLYTVQEFS